MMMHLPILKHAMASFWSLVSVSTLLGRVVANCECGYSITTEPNAEQHVFTDLLESDFVHLDITDGTKGYGAYGWASQDFNMSKEAARGNYGESFTTQDVVSNKIADSAVFEGPGSKGGDAGLHLVVKSQVQDGMVTGAQIATTDLNYYYGTYRAGIKITDVPGTCSAFFWYMNDTQEIDVEFLSAQFNRDNSSFPVNVVLQSKESNDAGFDASHTQGFQRIYLPFDPTAEFHEYRFDFLEDKVLFYADAVLLTEMNGTGVPSSPGHLLLSHWSNGNPGWSNGPPDTDATTTISYVKAYFNSSSESRQNDYRTRCKDPSASTAVCAIPDNNSTFFFSNIPNMAPNQTTYHEENGAGQTRLLWPSLLTAALVFSTWAGL
ncbi:glycoside hydrolase family 16 protein [Whalleya microplaca]|nr:glycoside hydrolase family 16 protein [Whalleya microplaca]